MEKPLDLGAGHLAFFKVLVMQAGVRAMRILHDVTDDDRRTLTRTLGYCLAIMCIGTLLLAAVPFRNIVSPSHPSSAKLALYLIPQALPLSIPVGLTFGILWGMGKVAVSCRSRTLVLLVAVMSSVASFTLLAWIVPVANQAFRVSMRGRPVMKGLPELTLGELGQLLEPGTHEPMALLAPRDLRRLALTYHTRWALAGAPLVLSFFALALAGRIPRRRLMLGFAGCTTIFGYYLTMWAARELGLDRTLPAFAAA